MIEYVIISIVEAEENLFRGNKDDNRKIYGGEGES